MNHSEEEITPQESLTLITSMIETTRHTISDNSDFFLLWGWATFIGGALQFYLKAIANYPQHYYAWLVTPIALVFHFIFLSKKSKQQRVKTFIGDANKYLWTAIGFSFMVMAFVFSRIGWQYCFPFYILFYGIGTYMTGCLLKFKPFIFGGATCGILAIVCPYINYDYQILLATLAILISYIIPGYMLRSYYKKTNHR